MECALCGVMRFECEALIPRVLVPMARPSSWAINCKGLRNTSLGRAQ